MRLAQVVADALAQQADQVDKAEDHDGLEDGQPAVIAQEAGPAGDRCRRQCRRR